MVQDNAKFYNYNDKRLAYGYFPRGEGVVCKTTRLSSTLRVASTWMDWVSFIFITSFLIDSGGFSVLHRRRKCWVNEPIYGGVAQLVVQLTCNQQVGGSSPFATSTYFIAMQHRCTSQLLWDHRLKTQVTSSSQWLWYNNTYWGLIASLIPEI